MDTVDFSLGILSIYDKAIGIAINDLSFDFWRSTLIDVVKSMKIGNQPIAQQPSDDDHPSRQIKDWIVNIISYDDLMIFYDKLSDNSFD